MKKLIFANCVLGLALIFSFCSKPDLKQELSTVTPGNTASDRDPCCAQFVVTSTTFNGADICGVYFSNGSCTSFTDNCGTSTGFGQAIQKNGIYCFNDEQPFRVTNTGGVAFSFYFRALSGGTNSPVVTLTPTGGNPTPFQDFYYDCGNAIPLCN
ncbi:MAG: hypothetical protein H7246_16155 [Phycisphaerae bacterium]|nr:hypothetical protein [Saprospiraceae bacterium]